MILTTRDPLVLALDRASKHTSASPPLSELFSGDECGDASIVAAERARRLRRRARPSRDSEKKRSEKELRAARREWSRGEVTRRHTFNSVDAYALAVEAHNALVKQLVPPEQLLVLDVTRQSTKALLLIFLSLSRITPFVLFWGGGEAHDSLVALGDFSLFFARA